MVEPKIFGATATRQVRAIGRLLLMTTRHGFLVVQKTAVVKVNVGSWKPSFWRAMIRMVLITVILIRVVSVDAGGVMTKIDIQETNGEQNEQTDYASLDKLVC